MAAMAASIVPSDDFEWLLVTDIVDDIWLIRRYRQMAAGLINSRIRTELRSLLPVPEVPESTTYMAPRDVLMPFESVEHTITEKELKEKRETRETVLKERKRSPYLADIRDYNAIHAQGFFRVIEHVERIEALIDSAEGRRNAAYKMLEQYRAQREGRRRAPSPSIIAGDFEDVSSSNPAADGPRHDV